MYQVEFGEGCKVVIDSQRADRLPGLTGSAVPVTVLGRDIHSCAAYRVAPDEYPVEH